LSKQKSQHQKNKKELSPLMKYMKQTERDRKKEYEHYLEYECDKLGIPKEILKGYPTIRMSGNHFLDFRGDYVIEEYTTELVRLRTLKHHILIQGSHLCLAYFTKDEIRISGNILNISYCSKGDC